MLGRLLISQHSIDLPQFQRGWVAFILDTNCELMFSTHNLQSKSSLTFISFLPMPCASYQCSSASHSEPSARRTRPTPFSFLHLPLPYILRNLAASWILLPTAIVSMFSSLPISSKIITNR